MLHFLWTMRQHRSTLGRRSYGQALERSQWAWRGQGGGVTRVAVTLESHIRGRKLRDGGKGSSPALHLKTLPNRANAFSDKEQDGTLCGPAVSSPASLCLSFLIPAPTGSQPSEATPGLFHCERGNSENQTETTPSGHAAHWKYSSQA